MDSKQCCCFPQLQEQGICLDIRWGAPDWVQSVVLAISYSLCCKNNCINTSTNWISATLCQNISFNMPSMTTRYRGRWLSTGKSMPSNSIHIVMHLLSLNSHFMGFDSNPPISVIHSFPLVGKAIFDEDFCVYWEIIGILLGQLLRPTQLYWLLISWKVSQATNMYSLRKRSIFSGISWWAAWFRRFELFARFVGLRQLKTMQTTQSTFKWCSLSCPSVISTVKSRFERLVPMPVEVTKSMD